MKLLSPGGMIVDIVSLVVVGVISLYIPNNLKNNEFKKKIKKPLTVRVAW